MISLYLTEEEATELIRTLIGRLDLDISPKLRKCKPQDMEHFKKMYELNSSVLHKLTDKGAQ